MKRRFTTAAITAALAGALALGGCGGNDTDASATTTTAAQETTAGETTEAGETTAPTTTAPPTTEALSDIEAARQRVIAALTALGIEHSEPVRGEVQLSGAKARFDMTVNGYDAGINVFPDAEALATWQELSDSFGGIHVAFDNAVLTLNTSEGVANSAEIAPLIAAEIGGEARGV